MKEAVFKRRKVKEVVTFRRSTEELLEQIKDIRLEIERLKAKRETVAKQEQLDVCLDKAKRSTWYERLSAIVKDVLGSGSLDSQIQRLEREKKSLILDQYLDIRSDFEVHFDEGAYEVYTYEVHDLMLSLDYLNGISSLLERRVRNLDRTIKLLFAEIAKMMMDKRARFRSIIRLLFKNLDDEHIVVNNLKVNALKDYLSLKTHYGNPAFKPAPRDFMGAAA